MSANADIQEKIAAARRDAETLKEKIRAKREQLGDTTRQYLLLIESVSPVRYRADKRLGQWK